MSPAHRSTGEITAVGRAAEILRQFAHSSGVLSASALTQRTGLPKTTVYRMVAELVRVGLLERTVRTTVRGFCCSRPARRCRSSGTCARRRRRIY